MIKLTYWIFLKAARKIARITSGMSRVQFNRDDIIQDSVVRQTEIIGEAAANVTKESQNKYSHIPWQNIIGMRNRLIHAYFDINLDILWKTITEDIPPLIAGLEKIIPRESKT